MKKNIKFILIMLFIFLLISFLIISNIYKLIQLKKCPKLYADIVIKLPNKEYEDKGFTGTGLFWDNCSKTFYIGNAGKYKPDDVNFNASVEVVDKDFSRIIKSIPYYKNHNKMRDIQGVSKTNKDTLVIASFGEDKVYQVDENGDDISSFYVNEPSGIAYDNRNDTIWVLTKNKLINYSLDGEIITNIKVKISGQDQIFLDERNNIIYISAGLDYSGDSYIYKVDLNNNSIKPAYILKDSFAIEGISIVDNTLYVINDGYYHNAKEPYNQVNIYKLK